MSWVDGLIVVVLVALVASRFFKFKLPRDDRPRDQRKGWREVVERFQQPQQPQPAEEAAGEGEAVAPRTQGLRAKGRLVVPNGLTGVAALKAVDPEFDEAGFLKGAREAYGFFHDKWAARDEAELAHLCAPRLLDDLLETGKDAPYGKAPGKGEVKSAKIAGARLNGRTAVVEVDFEALHGKKVVKSRWTLARAVGGIDPNWELQGFQPLV